MSDERKPDVYADRMRRFLLVKKIFLKRERELICDYLRIDGKPPQCKGVADIIDRLGELDIARYQLLCAIDDNRDAAEETFEEDEPENDREDGEDSRPKTLWEKGYGREEDMPAEKPWDTMEMTDAERREYMAKNVDKVVKEERQLYEGMNFGGGPR